jgi:hypothetical protein
MPRKAATALAAVRRQCNIIATSGKSADHMHSARGYDARAVARLLCAPRPSQAAISSSLLLIFSFRVWGHLGRGKGARSYRGSAPL